jgi:hypothetical protein
MGAQTGETRSLLEPFIVFGLWAIVAVPICPDREGEGIKGTAVLTRVLDKIKEQLEGS